MVPGSPEVPPVNNVPAGQPSPDPSPNGICNRVASISFWLTLVFLGLFVAFAFFAIRSLGLWQLGGRADPTAETLARFAMICLFVAMISNATAFFASLWGRVTGKSKPVLILWLSGGFMLASAAYALSLMP
jgi:hypothetical protein